MVGLGVRLGAATIDLAAGLFLALALAPTAVGYYFATRAVVLLRIGEPDTWFQGPAALVIGLLGEFVFALPLALMLVLLPDAFGWRSLGKRLFGFRVVAARPSGLVVRFSLAGSPLWLSTLALVLGDWWIVELAMIAALVLGLSGLMGCLSRSPSLMRRITGTELASEESYSR